VTYLLGRSGDTCNVEPKISCFAIRGKLQHLQVPELFFLIFQYGTPSNAHDISVQFPPPIDIPPTAPIFINQPIIRHNIAFILTALLTNQLQEKEDK
jgi:hypothetical protein